MAHHHAAAAADSEVDKNEVSVLAQTVRAPRREREIRKERREDRERERKTDTFFIIELRDNKNN